MPAKSELNLNFVKPRIEWAVPPGTPEYMLARQRLSPDGSQVVIDVDHQHEFMVAIHALPPEKPEESKF